MRPIILRQMIPAHDAIVRRLHREQNERDGTSYPLPRIFDRNGLFAPSVPVALVGVPEGETDPVQAIWVERRAELMFAGCDPKATAFARRDIDGLLGVLAWLGYTGLHCDVPIERERSIAKPLAAAGFEPTDERLVHFYQEIKP